MKKKKKGEFLFFSLRAALSRPDHRHAREKKKMQQFLTVDASSEVDEGSVDLDGRDRAEDDVACLFVCLFVRLFVCLFEGEKMKE